MTYNPTYDVRFRDFDGTTLTNPTNPPQDVNTTFTDGNDQNWVVNETPITESSGSEDALIADGGIYVGTITVNGSTYPVLKDGAIDDWVVLFHGQNALDDARAATAGGSGTETVTAENFDACFAKGTRIATPSGETLVEDLQIGDEVLTADGRAERVVWIGSQDLFPSNIARHMQPVRIRAGALGPDLPSEDLIVTGNHAIHLDGYLVDAAALVNRETIDFVPLSECGFRLTVYHVETEAHEVLIANGLPAESFLDQPNRQCFDNYETYIALSGADRQITQMDVPRIPASRLLPLVIKERIKLHDAGEGTARPAAPLVAAGGM